MATIAMLSPLLIGSGATAAAAAGTEGSARPALVQAFATTRVPDGPVTGPELTVAIDGVVIATAMPFGTVAPLDRMTPGEHLVQVFLPDVAEPIQEQPVRLPGGNRYDIVLGQSPSGGAGLPFVHVFANHTNAPAHKTRLTLRNVSDAPLVSILVFGPFTPPALIDVPRGEQGSAVLAATFSELKVIPSTGSDPCAVPIMEEFPAKTATVIYAAGRTHDGQGELICAFDAVIRRL